MQAIAFSELARLPVILAGAELMRNQAFGGDVSDDQEAVVWEAVEQVYGAILESHKVTSLQFSQLAAAWKGVSNWLGWGSVAPTLDPSLRAGIAYVFGHRYLRLGKPEEAATFFEQARKDAPTGSGLARLAQTDLELLKARRGQLLVESDFPGKLQLAVQQEGKEVAKLDVPAKATLDLPAGSYRLSLVSTPADVVLSSDQVAMTPAGRRMVRVAWLWKPGSRDHGLPGLVPRPAKLPHLGRWQAEMAAPRGPVYGVSWGGDGRWVACATGSVARVYEFPGLRPVRLFLGHREIVVAAALQPQGVRLASTSYSEPARLWDVTTGIPGPILDDSSHGNRSAAWSPDGQRLLLSSDRSNQSPSLWNADGSLVKICSGHTSPAPAACWGPDSSSFASAGQDGTLRLWNRDGVAGRVIEVRSKEKQSDWPHRLAWGAGGRWLAISGIPDAKAIQLWDTSSWKPGPVFQEGRIASCCSLAWSPNGKSLAAAGFADTAAWLWDVERNLQQRLVSHANRPVSLAWEPTGKRIAIGGDDGTLRFCSIADDAPGPVLGDHGVRIADIVRSRDGKWLASRGHDENVVRLWSEDGRPGPVLKGHAAHVSAIAWSPDGTRLASSSADKTIRLWKTPSGEAAKVLTGHSDLVLAVAWSPDGKTLVSAGADGTIRLWKADDGSTIKVLSLDKIALPIQVEWSPDGKRFALSGPWPPNSAMRIFGADGTPGPVLKGEVHWMSWSPDGNSIACGCGDNMVRIIAAADGRPGPEMKGHTAAVWHLAWSPDGKFLASCGSWGDVQPRLWHADGRPVLVGWPADHQYMAVAWDPTGKWLALAFYDGEIRLWEVAGNQAGPVLKGHSGSHQRISWAADGRHLISTSTDNTLRRWDTTTGELSSVTVPLPNGQAAYLSPGGKLEVTSPEAERELVYIVEQPNREQKLFSPAEFRQLIAPRQTSQSTSGKQ